MWCFVHFDLQMCSAPQRRAIFGNRKNESCSGPKMFCTFWLANQRRAFFGHWNSKNGCGAEVFCAFWLANMLRATAACHFWTSEEQKLLWTWGVLAFWLANALLATAAHNFSTLWNFKKWSDPTCFAHFHLKICFAPQRRAFSFLCWTATSAPAALASLLFEHRDATNHSKSKAVRDFPKRWRVCIFFLETLLACWSSFFWLDFSGRLFNCPYCRKLDF